MVMAHHADHLSVSSVPSNMKVVSFCWMARWMSSTCCATTESTSRSMRLNSSKHAQAPELASPYEGKESE
jgi:hypothetical protein